MADTRPTPIGFLRALQLCFLLLFAPNRFIEHEARDIESRNEYKDKLPQVHRAHIVRQALLSSMLLVLASAAVGYGTGLLMAQFGRCATTATVAWLQIIGASLLLWGTLFIRGWEILSWSGVTLTERVNQWLYRGLYCIGTAVVVYSLSFPACAQ
jgi:hypothetical protein